MNVTKVSVSPTITIEVVTYLDTDVMDFTCRMPTVPPEGTVWRFGTGLLGELVTFVVAKHEYSTLIKPYRCDKCEGIHLSQDGVNITVKLEPVGINEKLLEDLDSWFETIHDDSKEINQKEVTQLIVDGIKEDKPHPFISYFKAAEDPAEIEHAIILLVEMTAYLANGKCMGMSEESFKAKLAEKEAEENKKEVEKQKQKKRDELEIFKKVFADELGSNQTHL